MKEEYLKEIFLETKTYFLVSFLLFFVAAFCGFLIAYHNHGVAREHFNSIVEAFSPILSLGPVEMGFFILLNNTIKIFIFIFLGIFLAIPTIFFLIFNGLTIGMVVAIMYPQLGLEGIFMSLFFHGLFELTASFLGAGLGIRLGVITYKRLKNVEKINIKNIFEKRKEIKKDVSFSFNCFMKIILPLLFIAASIETIIIFFI